MKQVKEMTKRMKQSVTLKLVLIGILMLLLLIPAGMIKSLILEREQTSKQVTGEISDLWGNKQTITGPYLTVPYKKYIQTKDGVKTDINYLHILPGKLKISGVISPEIRYRGIYKVVVYNSKLHFSGTFLPQEDSTGRIDSKNIIWKEATVNLGIPDMRGIQENLKLQLDSAFYSMNPGIATRDLVKTGISTPLVIEPGKEADFNLELNLNGSNELAFIPLGKETIVNLHSNWENPSFKGAFLPRERKIDNEGFTAEWKILHLNRSYPQQWSNNAYNINSSSFGVSLLLPVDHYQKAYRSAKYALMFIALTFLTFFFIEVLNQKQIHPIQYLLVGLALVIFFSLLVALSEQMPFVYAYLIAAAANIALISVFAAGIFKNTRLTMILTIILVVLYIFLYTVLQLMDYALLMGNLGLFAALAIVMFISRKVNWYDRELKHSEV